MNMYKKVFEKKFPCSADATEFLDSTGWNYLGKKGILRQFHLYEGVTIKWDGTLFERLKLRLYSDGHVILYNDYSLNGILGVSGLPTHIWPSYDIYNHLRQCIYEYNDKLANECGHTYIIKDEGYRKYAVYKLEKKDEVSIGKIILKPAIQVFETPRQAFDWAVSHTKVHNISL